MNGQNELTVRDESGNVIATPHVGSGSVLWKRRKGTIRSMRETAVGAWISSQQQEIAIAGGDQQAFLDRIISVADEYRY